MQTSRMVYGIVHARNKELKIFRSYTRSDITYMPNIIIIVLFLLLLMSHAENMLIQKPCPARERERERENKREGKEGKLKEERKG